MSLPLPENLPGSDGIEVGHLHVEPGKHVIPELPVHVIGVHLGPNVVVVQEHSGRLDRREALAGDIVIIPQGTPNICIQDETSDYLTLKIEPQEINLTAEAIGLDSRKVEIIDNFGTQDSIIRHIIPALQHERLSNGLGGTLYVEALTTQLFVHLLRAYSAREIAPKIDLNATRPFSEHQFRHTIDFIHDNLSQKISLKELADGVQFSPYHFSRSFKRTTGLAPHQYVLQKRLERAKYLLLSTRMPIVDIAKQTGFYDQSHFGYHFKRMYGITPAALRKNLLAE